MKKLFILATFLFIDYYTGIAQFQSINFSELEKKAISLCKERKYEAALSLYLSLEDQIKISSKRHQLAFHISRHNVIKYILLRKKTSDLDKYVLESIEKIEEINGKSDTILIDFYRTLGLSSFNLTKYQEAENSFDHALKIYSNNPQYEGHYSIASLFDITIKNLISKGDIYNALIYCKKALAFAKEHFDETDSTFGKIFERFGHCYRKLNSIEESKFYYEKALVVYRNFYGDNNLNISNIYDRIGRLHIASDDYQEAIQYLQKGLRIRKNILEPTDFKIGASFDNIGNSYYYLKEYQKAIIFFRKALGAFRYSASKTTHADQYSKIAACYTNLNDFQKAEHYLDSCFRILEFDRDIDHPFEEYRSSHTHLLIILYFKAKNHQKAYEAGLGTEELQEAAYWFNLCVELIEYINSTFEESGSKQYLLDRFYYIFEAAINCRYYLYQETGSPSHIEQAFGYAERSKALLLKEAMQMADASPETGIPQRLQEEERRLKKAIIGLENQRYELQQQGEPHTIHELNSEIFDLKQDYHRIVDSIRQQYPRAHRMRYAAAPLAPEHIQNELLSPGQALLQYFLGEEHLFLFVITQQATTLIKRPAEQGLAEAVHRFRESIYGWSRSQEDSLVQQYAIYGHRLYQMLIEPAASMLPERLIIIPDGILEYVPFEALLKEAARPGARPFTSYPFFIRDHQVSYAHSAGLLHEMRNTSYQAPRQWILAFAPAFQDAPDQEQSLASRRRNLGRLVSNVKEVQSIKSLLRTRIFKGDDATRERFLADAPYYSIIHLATHAKANDEEGEYSYLAFTEISDTLQNELLYARDLYSMRLQAEMVVLSACESGVGELRRGEGVISLARGFSYAGAKSLVTTLWRVSDRESAALMELFYRHLKEGEPKDRALREAKLQFINQPGQGRAHPFFWAAFVLSGDMAPIVVEQSRFTVWVLVLLGVLFVFLLARYTKRKPS